MDKFQLITEELRSGFVGNLNKTYHQRIMHLSLLEKAIRQNESYLINALKEDFKKPEFETELTELFPFYLELKHFKKKLKDYMSYKEVNTPLTLYPAQSFIQYEPKGVVMIIGAWNYPINLTLIPVLNALAAGNTVLLKPSEIASYTSTMLARILNQTFDARVLKVVEGGAEVTQKLLSYRFDHIFFTGSSKIGKLIYQEAAKTLTPVTLELGGKSPAIVDKNTNIEKAIKRILWGKLVNAGQTCVAPDYLFFPRSKKKELISYLSKFINEFEWEDEEQFAHIINEQHYQQLKQFLKPNENYLYQGNTNDETLWISFFAIEVNDLLHPLMQEEIFGPILPVIFYDHLDEFYDIYAKNPNPLSLYIFSKQKKFIRTILQNFPSGGVLINDCLMHLAHVNLPFGGRGNSGIGNYHGFTGFKCFSHEKSVMKQKYWLDAFYRYPKYTNKRLNLIRRIKKLF